MLATSPPDLRDRDAKLLAWAELGDMLVESEWPFGNATELILQSITLSLSLATLRAPLQMMNRPRDLLPVSVALVPKAA